MHTRCRAAALPAYSHRLCRRCQRPAARTAPGAAARTAAAQAPPRSRQATSAPGCARSHSSTVACSRPASTPTARPVSLSASSVAYACPLRSGKSPVPGTRTSPAAGSGSAIRTRVSVCRLASAASTRAASVISTRRPPAAASASVRGYRPCTRVHQAPHRGHAAPSARGRTHARTRPGPAPVFSASTGARYGSSTASPASP